MGAGPAGGGLSAVQTHMTNTRNTPVEALEMRFPLRVTRYALRENSGGTGARAGGDGMVREFEFLAPTVVTLLTERRRHPPWGLAGGAAGAPGVNLHNGEVVPGKVCLTLGAGERLTVPRPVAAAGVCRASRHRAILQRGRMSMNRTPWRGWLAVLVLGTGLAGGCAPILIGGGAPGGYPAGQGERGAGRTSDDAAITAAVNSRYVKDDLVHARDIDVDTYRGVVDPERSRHSSAAAARAVSLARQVRGVTGWCRGSRWRRRRAPEAMCGISGELRLDGGAARSGGHRAHDRRRSRGAGRITTGPICDGPFAFGHRRLSVIDLSAAPNQPLVDRALGLVLVFNGTIYNYRELRASSRPWATGSFPTETARSSSRPMPRWGEAASQRLHGMFAFAIWDTRAGSLFLARDRLGIKPLYYQLDAPAPALRLATARRCLPPAASIPTLDPVALHHHLTLHAVVPAPRTVLAGRAQARARPPP